MATVIDAVLRLRDQMSAQLEHVRNELQQTERVTQRMSRSVRSVGSSLKSMGETLAPIGAAAVAAGTGAAMAFSQFEDGAAKVQAKLDQTDWGKMPELKKQALELSKEYRQSATEIEKIQEGLASAGLSANDTLTATEGVLQGVDASGAQAEVVVSLATNTLMAFGLQAKDLGGVMDQLVVTANATDTSMDLMAETLKYCSSAAHMAGVDLSEVNTAAGLLANVGQTGSQAGTGIKDMLTRLQLPAHIEELKQLGVNVIDNNGKFVGLRNTIAQLAPVFNKMTDSEKAAAAHSIFGDVASPAAIALLQQGVDKFDQLHNQIKNSSGAAEKAAEVLNNTLAAKLDKLKNNAFAAGVALGEQLAPYIEQAAAFLGNLAKSLSALTPEQTKLIIVIAGIITAISGLLVVGGSAIIFFSSFVSSVTALAAAVAAAGGPLAFITTGLAAFKGAIIGVGRALMTLFMNPVAAAIAAVMLFAFAAYEVYTHWDGIKEYFSGLWEGIKAGVMNNVEYISNCWESIKSSVANNIAYLGNCWNSVKQGAFDAWNGIKAAAIQAITAIVGEDRLKKLITNWNALKKAVTELVTEIRNEVSQKFNALVGAIAEPVSKAAKEVSERFNSIKKAVSDWAGGVYKAVSEAFSKAKGSANNELAYIGKVVTKVFQSIVSFLKSTGSAVLNAITTPYKVAFTILKGLFSAWLGTVVAVFTTIVRTGVDILSDLLAFLTNVFTGNWAAAWEAVSNIFSDVFHGIEEVCTDVMNGIKAAINAVIDGINSISVDIPDWVPQFGGQHFSVNVPHLYTGTENWPGGVAMIHDKGAEIVDLPQGTRVIPHDQSMQIMYQNGMADALNKAVKPLRNIGSHIVNVVTTKNTMSKILQDNHSEPVITNNSADNRQFISNTTAMTQQLPQQESNNVNITIPKLADSIVVREESDIDRIANELVFKLKSHAINSMGGALV
ncbi:putative tail tape measure protein (plasmid) [Selenomonas ruminantium subsp. lactilytica TAM6421]|uniref:Putative tail tape measure protein n=1 Tax=Selenomonas ruminantium subsp. lactilytica (strain NBRC 103574 / TAM6421) TaxID=927704 RepID=I0GWR9_SELRL|nr:phage tail tape measure protein [Selenomonas ruminantium]BAL85206.1 putative tail tape measure protein [Selenomonas ruminantium subsp. lactilytica TAM6421]